MFAISSTSLGSEESETSRPPPQINWSQFIVNVIESGSSSTDHQIKSVLLKGSPLSCSIHTEAGQWENRKIYMEQVFADLIAHCPKDEPLVLISFGSDRLITEYVLGQSLIENGFRQILFFLIDPSYTFSEKASQKSLNQAIKDFRQRLEIVNFSINHQPLAKEAIRFFSRCQNVSKYFPDGANVVVIESLPPHAYPMKQMVDKKLTIKPMEDLLLGSHLVPSDHANAVTFIPGQFKDKMRSSGIKCENALPLTVVHPPKPHSEFYFDWGCKIQQDGTFRISFTGVQEFLKTLNVNEEKHLKHQNSLAGMKNCVEWTLHQEIGHLRGDQPARQLAQAEITSLLEKVVRISQDFLPGLNCYYSVDYVFDRKDALRYLSAHAGHHYRKMFSLLADPVKAYQITVTTIQ